MLIRRLGGRSDAHLISLGKALGRALKANKYGAIIGNDFAGTVEELGPEVPEGVRTVNERVGGFVLGSQSSGLSSS